MKQKILFFIMYICFYINNIFFGFSYMILAPAAMTAEKDPKKAAQKCFDGIQLDADNYRIGHTKVI